MKFEEVLAQYNPMISACMRKLGIYKNQANFRQAGMIGLWKAFEKYDSNKGELTSFAYRYIYGAMLDELKKENIRESPCESDTLTSLMENNQAFSCHNEKLCCALEQLNVEEQKVINLLFNERISIKEASKQLNITISGVKKRRERILRKLRDRLE